jgi:hypothetical protein
MVGHENGSAALKAPKLNFSASTCWKMMVYTARNGQRVYSLLLFPATVTVTRLPVASEKSNRNVTVELMLLQYREVQ